MLLEGAAADRLSEATFPAPGHPFLIIGQSSVPSFTQGNSVCNFVTVLVGPTAIGLRLPFRP